MFFNIQLSVKSHQTQSDSTDQGDAVTPDFLNLSVFSFLILFGPFKKLLFMVLPEASTTCVGFFC